ncbi:MAG: tRNA dihydrouridine synthase B (EC [uncultured Campylobacterales bacterium]|uniref:tRNA-dihydrouridine synthase n=1 Tax=uncultured Campylobacterales bacterium TaxID=352960 RepID=A0A6S6SFH5_9BACT|nr:MAG: tRNA dihydrouridine synthase B (EC [uncultured Campylobacterales bacterium]
MGTIKSFDNLVVLAPLAGFTDLPFRSVAKKFGVDLTYSEMINSNALVHHSKKTFHMIEKAPNETPYIVQIAGNEPEIVKKAVLILNEIDGIDGIDLNCGCPVKKIIKTGSGSALLDDLDQFKRVIETIKEYSNKEYTSVKVRLGFKEKNHVNIAKAVESAGADFMAIHGRTAAQMYKGNADWDAIKEAKAAISIPLFANGDITDYDTAKHVKEHTKADGIMIGRGAIGNPWIFYQIKNSLGVTPKDKIKEIVLEHFHSIIEFYGEDTGIRTFRKHLHTYSKGQTDSSEFRDKVNTIISANEMEQTIINFF